MEKLTNFSAKSLKNETAWVAQISEASTTHGPPYMSPELDDDIKCLYKTLKKYRSCKLKESYHEIITNIRLNGYRTLVADSALAEFIVDNASAEFGVLFLDHPHEGKSYWQEACIQICHTKSADVPTL